MGSWQWGRIYRFSLSTLLASRSFHRYQSSSSSPPVEQLSVLGCWLDFAIHHLPLNSSGFAASLEGPAPSDTLGFPKRTICHTRRRVLWSRKVTSGGRSCLPNFDAGASEIGDRGWRIPRPAAFRCFAAKHLAPANSGCTCIENWFAGMRRGQLGQMPVI
jgi:hypothetical protein